MFGRGIVTGLLFPSPVPPKTKRSSEDVGSSKKAPAMVTDLRKALDAVGERAGFGPGEIRTKMFRHTFCAAALQLLDRGAPSRVRLIGRARKEIGGRGRAPGPGFAWR